MPEDDQSERELAFDITYALSRSAFRTPSQGRQDLAVVATEIVRYLKLANWIFGRKSPPEPH